MTEIHHLATPTLVLAIAIAAPTSLSAQVAPTFPSVNDSQNYVHPVNHKLGYGHRGGRGMMSGLVDFYDTDGDGELTQEELLEAREAQLKRHDTNQDGMLDLQEYETLWLEAMRERMVDRFQQHDDNGDGLVTVEEFNEEYQRLIGRSDEDK